MKLAISNIAWPAELEADIAGTLRTIGVRGIEIAPTKRWPAPAEASAEEMASYRRWWEGHGLPIVALQSLLFGRAELRVFGDADARKSTADYLKRMIALGAALGAHVLVFGSPVNRRVDGLDPRTAHRIALDFFADVGSTASEKGVVIGLEPNPPEYRCDWLTDTRSCVSFLNDLQSPGVALHLDAAALTLNEEPVGPTFELAAPWLRHFHASEPHLATIGEGGAPHAAFATALQSIGFGGWVSIEMRPPEHPERAPALVRASIDIVAETYAAVR